MFIVYDLIFLVFALISLPVYIARRKFHPGFMMRLGFLPGGLIFNRPIWVHAVSVGEASAVRGLVEALRQAYPGKKFVISTVTPTGNKIARSIIREGDAAIYLPFDFSFVVSSVLGRVNPCLFVLAETEIWPNLIRALAKRKVPIAVVNARISDRSMPRYRLIKFLAKPVLNRISAFCAQTEIDASRLLVLGVAKEKIRTTGNMKFDSRPQVLTFDNISLGLSQNQQLLVCGSTHPSEEAVILKVYKNLLVKFPGLRVLIAPRHPERAREVSELISKEGLEPVFLSRPGSVNNREKVAVFILDTIGQLFSCYALADIVFVGGSLVKIGGHNILEPAWQGKPVIFGTQMFNFRDITDMFVRNKAGIMVNNAAELEDRISFLLDNPAAAKELSRRAQALIAQNQGATMRNLEIIKKVYAGISL